MATDILSPAEDFVLSVPVDILSIAIALTGVGLFLWMIFRRIVPLLKASSESCWNDLSLRLRNVICYWLLQWRHPRYMLAGVIHILLFSGFLILLLRSFELTLVGVSPGFVFPDPDTLFGQFYNPVRSVMATVVLIVAVFAMIRRGFFNPIRYETPDRYKNSVAKFRSSEVILILILISLLMLSEALFDASGNGADDLLPMTTGWFISSLLSRFPQESLQILHTTSYLIHDLLFFGFLCFLPLGKHFHIITGLFNIFFMRIRHGNIRAVKDGVSDEEMDGLDSLGVKHLEDFSWKDMLDFYSCVDCGRCSDNCPATRVGRPLSPRFISVKTRKHIYDKYPLIPNKSVKLEVTPLIGSVFDEDEIWSCVTCGACEQECPVGISYIDKIVDLRRGMVDEGKVPQSLQKPLRALEKKGNPFGKSESKRAEWADNVPDSEKVRVLGDEEKADTLYFVDSITSYNARTHSIAQSTATLLSRSDVDFGILGSVEKDSGHEVRRFGEEFLFRDLRDENTESIKNSGACKIVTSDPHAMNALKNDYNDVPEVEHISQTLARKVADGNISFKELEDTKTYTFHDPCYLGRHNKIYNDPRIVIDAIPGMTRVEMEQCKDRSFCCGGGGLNIFYEAKEDERMGVKRVKMAKDAGADVIVTACPNCMVNLEDAVKVAGFEQVIEVIDLVELAVRQAN